MYCHDHPLVTAPPTSGPAATATPPMAPHIPSAWLRRSGGTAADSRVSDSGMISAPPAPWTARAVTRKPIDGRQRGGGRGGGEDDEAQEEHPTTPEAVAQRGRR